MLNTTTTIPRLSPRTFLPTVLQYMRMQSKRAEHEREARALKVSASALRTRLRDAMSESAVAYCGTWKLSAADVETIPARLTTDDGRVVNLTDIRTIVLKDGTKLSAADIATVFGGRSGYATLDIEPIHE